MRRTIIACVAVALVVGSTTATAASLISGKEIRNGSVTGKDLKNGSVKRADLSKGIRTRLAAVGAQGGQPSAPGAVGAPGAKGDNGAKGDKGEKGDKGDAGPVRSSGNWGVINRNTEGSPAAFLRSGPVTATSAPLGKGSLNLLVGSGTEKVSYGNEVDFAGDAVGDLESVGYRVFQTGENSDKGDPNMPSITFEIDPNLTATPSNYSSLVFVPAENSPANGWSDYIDATTTGKWGLTGAAGAATGCPLSGGLCTFAEVQQALVDGGERATILTVAVTKGKDSAWQGAVDGLRINDDIFDFEETGVSVE